MLTKQMDFVLELSRTLNFNRAAENLFISQPALSYQIKMLEEEVGFRIFCRKGKSVQLTPAGAQFVMSLQNIRTELQRAVEQGQTFSSRYTSSISIGVSVRSMLLRLPDALVRFAETHPSTEVVPYFQYYGMYDSFLRGERDILFALYERICRYPELKFHPLYTSRIYLITEHSDPLCQKEMVYEEDLAGRTLMIGGGSPNALRAVQQRVMKNVQVNCLSSPDHDSTLTNVAAHRGVCLAPGFLNDGSGLFAWTPFDCEECIPCVLCTHGADEREEVLDFVRTLQALYSGSDKTFL